MADRQPTATGGWGRAVKFEELPDRIGLLTLDAPEKKVNTLGRATLAELSSLVASLATRDDLMGMLVTSAKPGQFVAGADLNELAALASADKQAVADVVRFGHTLFGAVASLPFPVVALVDGACMGGGTELILSCDERLVSLAKHTSVGLPETKIGLIPAWGGTQRLPRLVGLHYAIEMITSGEAVDPAKAVAIGLAFDAVPPAALVDEGRRLLGILRDGDLWRRRRAERSGPIAVSTDKLALPNAVSKGAVRGKKKGQYPTPPVELQSVHVRMERQVPLRRPHQ
ncbi:MAG: enoyl-CoA hydratase-related protein, partial [Planctomycetaceae bacterium]